MSKVREFTNKLREAMDEGMVTAEQVAMAAMCYMSEDEVKDMCVRNELLIEEDEEEDEDDEEE